MTDLFCEIKNRKIINILGKNKELIMMLASALASKIYTKNKTS